MSHTLYSERRIVASQRLQEYWATVVLVIPLAFGPLGTVHTDALQGWAPKAGGDTVWWNIEAWTLGAPSPDYSSTIAPQ